MFICGSESFGHQEESPCTAPKRSKKSPTFCKIISKDHGNKHLYANQGLDTFNALLADLEDKKQQIYTQIGPEHISLVRFVYTNDSKRPKPIIVKVKSKSTQHIDSPRDTIVSPTFNVTRDGVTQLYSKELEGIRSPVQRKENRDRNDTMRYKSARFKLHDLRLPRYYFPMVVVLVLMLLALFGRSFGILCTTVMWYLIPMMAESSLKKEQIKEIEKKLMKSKGPSSPTSVLTKRLTNHNNQEHGRFRRSLVKTAAHV